MTHILGLRDDRACWGQGVPTTGWEDPGKEKPYVWPFSVQRPYLLISAAQLISWTWGKCIITSFTETEWGKRGTRGVNREAKLCLPIQRGSVSPFIVWSSDIPGHCIPLPVHIILFNPPSLLNRDHSLEPYLLGLELFFTWHWPHYGPVLSHVIIHSEFL